MHQRMEVTSKVLWVIMLGMVLVALGFFHAKAGPAGRVCRVFQTALQP